MDDDDNSGFVFDIPESSDRAQEIMNMRELLIFVIDCTDSMFETPDGGDSPFKRSLQCCRSVLMNKIIGSSNDLIGIVFYGTREKDPGDQNPKHVITLTEPQEPNADIIKQLERMIKSENQQEFDSKYGHSNDYSLSDVFWHSSSVINRVTVKIAIKKLILMTCSDHPHRDSPTKQHQARKKAEDLESLGIQLDVIPLREDFNGDLFYNELLQIVCGPLAQIEPGGVRVQEMLERQYRKDSKKRSIGKLLWSLGKDVAVGVDVYCFFRPLTIPPIRKLYRKTNEVVKSVAQTYNAETGERLLKSDLKQKIEIGNEEISFNMEEKEKLHIHEKPGLTLLGFKSMSYLTPEYHVQPAAFIYPSEDTMKGSTALFYQLLQRCLHKDKFALCYLIPRVRGKPKLAALVPQEEQRDGTVQIMPPGFHVIYLPYAENIRAIEIPKRFDIAPENVDLCKKIMKKILVKYKVSMFENPKVQTHWANVEALALNYPKPRAIVDSTSPDYEFISENRLKDLETQFVETFYVDGYDPEDELSKKRKYPAYSASAAGSRAKIQKMESDPDYVRKMAIAGSVAKLTVPVLKNFLTERGLHVGGFKKNDLVNAVYQELNINCD